MADEILTRAEAEQLGSQDGAAIATQVLLQIENATTQDLVDGLSVETLDVIARLAALYRQGGASDELVLAWRVACQTEINRTLDKARLDRQNQT